MASYREIKRDARGHLKRHYWIYVAACLVAAFIGAEFASSLNSITINFSLPEGDIFGRTEGVFAKAINGITNGTILGTIRSGIIQIVGSNSFANVIYVLLGLSGYLFIWLFVQNVYTVSMRRIFLEGRMYKEIRIQRFLFIIRVKKWIMTAWNMLVLSVFQMLWIVTIIGPFIVRYSYFMVPYILAENPGIGARKAMIISKKMMRGYKWKCFMLELSFLGWYILGALTGGLVLVLYVNPYKIATYSELYVRLRQQAKNKHYEFSELLCDTYLFKVCDKYRLQDVYSDIVRLEEQDCVNFSEIRYGFKGKLMDFLGISLFSKEKEAQYEAAQINKLRIALYKNIIAGNEYPGRLSIFQEKEKRKMIEHINYMRRYSLWSVIMLFFTFAFIGWAWEVLLHLVNYGTFVNRGMLHGPWLPIYGVGGIMILTILSKFKKNPLLEFGMAIVLCGTVEYLTSYVMEQLHGVRWWDYQGYFLNINGRICAEGLLVFGVGGIIIVYIAAPLLDNIYRNIQRFIVIPLCIVMVVIFGWDLVYSGKTPNSGDGVTVGADYMYKQDENYLISEEYI